MAFTWSEYQENIFETVPDPDSGNLVIIARAGSAKTTTGVEAINRLFKSFEYSNEIDLETGSRDGLPSIAFLAFNKSIADELRTKLPKDVLSSTFHALGLAALKNHLRGYVKVEGGKIQKIMNSLVKTSRVTEVEATYLSGPAMRLVNLARDMGIGVLVEDTTENWLDLIEHFDIDIEVDPSDLDGEDPELVCIDIARRLLNASNDMAVQDRMIDFGDMLYLCIKLRVPMERFDYVFVDEAQDTNPIQVEIIRKILKADGKLIAIGDDKQAIYGFRGASSDALDIIVSAFDAKVLPLSISYRCSKEVIRRAQRIVPDIEYAETAIEGFVGGVDEHWNYRQFKSTDVVLCRTNAPLISLAYKLIARDVPCKVLGREIGQGLIALIKKLKAKSINDLMRKIDDYRAEKVSYHASRGEDSLILAVEDKCDSLFAAMETLPVDATINDLIDHIMMLFNNQGAPVLTLCTIHKSKGLEFQTVYHLDSQLVPSKYAKKPWQMAQEMNLIYVATTRAKENLFFVTSKSIKWDLKEEVVDADKSGTVEEITG